ncbi:MAG: hypothetical protein COB93_06630 [Sneathiella sp.]|nr:MAG: hypothetical protein COB93_06630 [Sneathiella sp.]
MQQLLVNKSDIKQTKIVETPSPPLAAGDVRLKIDRFALTANNVTYAVAGDMIGYWKFFPAPDEGWGIVPVWGHAEVIESKCDGIEPSERVYGYFPMAEELVVQPARVRAHAFTDGMAHRSALPSVYNAYVRLAAIPTHDPALEDLQAILYPLFATSYMIYDYLLDNEYFGAEQILLGSASSKTALGVLQLLHDHAAPHPAVIGLTSSRNEAFVKERNICDQVVTYDNISNDVSQVPSVYIDMSGNADVRIAVHTRLGDQLRLSSSVGISHWDKFRPTEGLQGPKPKMFFAPAQIKKRQEEWGASVTQTKTMDAWRDLAIKSESWLTVKEGRGLASARDTYAALVAGTTAPTDGFIVNMA